MENNIENLHSWVLPKGILVHLGGIPYYIGQDTEVFGNTDPTKGFKPPSKNELEDFFNE